MGDITGHGDYRLLVNHRDYSQMLHLIDLSDAEPADGWPFRVHSTSMGTPVLADLDGDGSLEIINPTFTGVEV
ncbi:MAG TPA: hypothetical protein ENN07_05690, partial [candidate division Zixibacteria bacterium]|nr:hypothetical protein [candidate division Zixibacteria bacterium]